MKKIKTTILAVLSAILLFSSCSIEKRVHMSGYHNKGFISKRNSDIKEFACKNEEVTTKTVQNNHQNEKDDFKVENYPKLNKPGKDSSFSLDNSLATRYHDKTNDKIIENDKNTIRKNKRNKIDEKVNAAEFGKDYFSEFKNIRANNQKLKTTSSSDDGDSGSALLVIGLVLLIVGGGIILFVSILVGVILTVLGLILMIAGAVSSSSSKSSNKSEDRKYIDVVYLKNGSVIKGMIIEQTPNKSLKIQTKDGSIFVYKMEEVEKMSKELEN